MATSNPATLPTTPAHAATGPDLSTDEVWAAIQRTSFAVLGHVNPTGEPRSSGVVYAVVDRHLYVAVEPDGWKGRQITDSATVSLTIPVRRGGLLALVIPIPPATITFRARVTVHRLSELNTDTMPKALGSLVPPERARSALLFELVPMGRFATYGLGVSLQAMRDPVRSRALVPVAG
jgi:hypothetical protein